METKAEVKWSPLCYHGIPEDAFTIARNRIISRIGTAHLNWFIHQVSRIQWIYSLFCFAYMIDFFRREDLHDIGNLILIIISSRFQFMLWNIATMKCVENGILDSVDRNLSTWIKLCFFSPQTSMLIPENVSPATSSVFRWSWVPTVIPQEFLREISFFLILTHVFGCVGVILLLPLYIELLFSYTRWFLAIFLWIQVGLLLQLFIRVVSLERSTRKQLESLWIRYEQNAKRFRSFYQKYSDKCILTIASDQLVPHVRYRKTEELLNLVFTSQIGNIIFEYQNETEKTMTNETWIHFEIDHKLLSRGLFYNGIDVISTLIKHGDPVLKEMSSNRIQ